MKNPILFLLLLIQMTSCVTSNHVSNNRLIQKRKYTTGWFVKKNSIRENDVSSIKVKHELGEDEKASDIRVEKNRTDMRNNSFSQENLNPNKNQKYIFDTSSQANENASLIDLDNTLIKKNELVRTQEKQTVYKQRLLKNLENISVNFGNSTSIGNKQIESLKRSENHYSSHFNVVHFIVSLVLLALLIIMWVFIIKWISASTPLHFGAGGGDSSGILAVLIVILGLIASAIIIYTIISGDYGMILELFG